MSEVFEQWWSQHGVSSDVGILEQSFREVALNAWAAGRIHLIAELRTFLDDHTP